LFVVITNYGFDGSSQYGGGYMTTTKADARTMREINRGLLLDLLRREDSATRSDLARRSSLAKPTVSSIVDDLIAEGLVCETGPGDPCPRGGARGRLVALNPSAGAFLGLHFGVRHTALAVADARGAIRAQRVVGSFAEDPRGALRAAPRLAAELISEARLPKDRLCAVGVSIPGLVDHETGTCVLAPNLGWRGAAIQRGLREALGVPVVVRNSMQAGAIAEMRASETAGARPGPSLRERSFAWVYVGSGIGAAIVIEGRVFYGKRGHTGEIGHLRVADDGPPCACGRRGCLETVASGLAVEARARAAIEQGRLASHLADPKAIVAAADGGDGMAREIVDHAAEMLGVGLSSILNLLDLEMIVVDGPVVRGGDAFIEALRASVARHKLDEEGIPIVKSAIDGDPMLLGALYFAMETGRAQRGPRAADARAGV
jgi:N-acetylglucosamine repressor